MALLVALQSCERRCGAASGTVALRAALWRRGAASGAVALWRCEWRCGAVAQRVALRRCEWRCGAESGAAALQGRGERLSETCCAVLPRILAGLHLLDTDTLYFTLLGSAKHLPKPWSVSKIWILVFWGGPAIDQTGGACPNAKSASNKKCAANNQLSVEMSILYGNYDCCACG